MTSTGPPISPTAAKVFTGSDPNAHMPASTAFNVPFSFGYGWSDRWDPRKSLGRFYDYVSYCLILESPPRLVTAMFNRHPDSTWSSSLTGMESSLSWSTLIL